MSLNLNCFLQGVGKKAEQDEVEGEPGSEDKENDKVNANGSLEQVTVSWLLTN